MLEFKFARFVSAGILLAIAGTLAAGDALAATQSNPCIVWDVRLDKSSSQLTVHCTNDNNNYIAYVGSSGCGATNVDNIKLWHAQAVAAMLSKSTSYFYYTGTGCSNGEKGIDAIMTLHP
jgi:hypothetical protein